ncbi:hypothetical protein NIES4101_26010 (plasmid) [Calothrix sp. NIES-4101]|nr:hypothetical protein NIES4101_26010 [Calothrix sp. NIES-4101]
MHEAVAAIGKKLSPGGAFLSSVRLPIGEVEDRNCFVTGLVLRETATLPECPTLKELRRKASAFLLRSQYPSHPYSFAFYPLRSHPFWMQQALYADADDTSVIALELVRAGHWPAEVLTRIIEQYLFRYRAIGDLRHHRKAVWQPEGVFLTWFSTACRENPIDCCVNTNVVALLAVAGLAAHESYTAACVMINAAAQMTVAQPSRLRAFTPYYPHPVEWFYALDHAVQVGACELLPAREAIGSLQQVQESLFSTVPLCSDAVGNIVWTAEVITLARRLRHQAN